MPKYKITGPDTNRTVEAERIVDINRYVDFYDATGSLVLRLDSRRVDIVERLAEGKPFDTPKLVEQAKPEHSKPTKPTRATKQAD